MDKKLQIIEFAKKEFDAKIFDGNWSTEFPFEEKYDDVIWRKCVFDAVRHYFGFERVCSFSTALKTLVAININNGTSFDILLPTGNPRENCLKYLDSHFCRHCKTDGIPIE